MPSVRQHTYGVNKLTVRSLLRCCLVARGPFDERKRNSRFYKRSTAQTVQLGAPNVEYRQVSVITELLLKTMVEEKRVSKKAPGPPLDTEGIAKNVL